MSFSALNMSQVRGRDRRKIWERDGEKGEMTRGRKVTERPSSACPGLKEKRWNTHTDSPSVNRVRERGREGGVRAREGEALCFCPISFCSSSRSRHLCPVLSVPHVTIQTPDKKAE